MIGSVQVLGGICGKRVNIKLLVQYYMENR